MPAYRVRFAGYIARERYTSLGVFTACDHADAIRSAPGICLQMLEMASDPAFRRTKRRRIARIEDRHGNIIAKNIAL